MIAVLNIKPVQYKNRNKLQNDGFGCGYGESYSENGCAGFGSGIGSGCGCSFSYTPWFSAYGHLGDGKAVGGTADCVFRDKCFGHAEGECSPVERLYDSKFGYSGKTIGYSLQA